MDILVVFFTLLLALLLALIYPALYFFAGYLFATGHTEYSIGLITAMLLVSITVSAIRGEE